MPQQPALIAIRGTDKYAEALQSLLAAANAEGADLNSLHQLAIWALAREAKRLKIKLPPRTRTAERP